MKTKKYEMNGGGGLKTKKYEMNGGGEKGKKWKSVKKGFKAITGSTVLTGFRYKKYKSNDPREKKRSLPGKIASELTSLPTISRILRAPKQILYSVPKYLATRGLVRKFAFTRSGKAQKEIRQTTGIKDYNKIKKQADSLEAKKQKYKEKLKTLAENAKTVSNANTRSKWSKIFGRRLQTKSYYEEDGVKRQSWLQRKFGKQTKSTMIDIESRKLEKKQKAIKDKEQFILDKWKKRIAFQTNKATKGKRKGKTVFKSSGITNGDLKKSLTAASKHVEDQKRIKRDEALQKAFESKKTYTDAKSKFDAVEGSFKTARDKYYDALAKAGGKANPQDKKEYAVALEAYREARSSKTKYSIQVPKTSFGSPVLGADGRQETESKEVTYKDMQGYIRGLQKIYNKDQTNYQKIAGKAQTLEQLADRSRNTESLKRGLKKLLPGARPFGGLLTTYGKILSSANKTTNTAKTKRNKDLIVKYWTKDKEGREQKLKEYLATGELNLKRTGKTKKIDPNTKQVMTLEEIIKKEVSDPNDPSKQINIVDTMTYKDYLVHLKNLQSKGDITSKEYEVLQKYGKAKRINKIINASDKQKTLVDITTKKGQLDVMTQRLGESGKTYKYGTPIKKTDLVTGFGKNAGDISKVKLLSLVDYETKEEKSKIESEIKYINTIKDTKIRDQKITDLYAKYGATIPAMKENINISDFNPQQITKYVIDTSTIFKDTEVKNELFTIFKAEEISEIKPDPIDSSKTITVQVKTGKIVLPTTTINAEIQRFKTEENKEFMSQFTQIDIPKTQKIIELIAKKVNTEEGKNFIASSIVKEALDEKIIKLQSILNTTDVDQINKLRDLDLLKTDNTLDPDKVLKHMLEEDKVMLNAELVKVDNSFNIDKYISLTATDLDPEKIKQNAENTISSKIKTLEETEIKNQAQIISLNLPQKTLEEEPTFIDFKTKNEAEKLNQVDAAKVKLRQAEVEFQKAENLLLPTVNGNGGRNGNYGEGTLEKMVQTFINSYTPESKKAIEKYIQNPTNKGVQGAIDSAVKNEKLAYLTSLLTNSENYNTAYKDKTNADPVADANEKLTNLEEELKTLKISKETAPQMLIKDQLQVNVIDAINATPEDKANKLKAIDKYIAENSTESVEIKELSEFKAKILELDNAKTLQVNAELLANEKLKSDFSKIVSTPGAIPNKDLVEKYNKKVALQKELDKNKLTSDNLIKDYLETTGNSYTPLPPV